MEFAILGTLLVGLLLPISDVAMVTLEYMRTFQTMRNVAALIQYNPPTNLASPAGSWPMLPSISGYAITAVAPATPPTTPPQSNLGNTVMIYVTVFCADDPPGGRACTTADTTDPTVPKWYYLSANVAVDPLYLTSLVGGVISYSERFQ